MEATLRPRERAKILGLQRKILDVPDHVHDYSGKIEVLDQIMTALLEEQPVVIKHASKKAERRQFRIDPYTLVTHKRALYLVGFSHHHKAVRTFSIDGIVDATRQMGASFAYPKEWNPAKLFEGAFGIIPGEETEVTLRFDASVEAWLRARIWHPTQSIRKKGQYLYLTMRPRGTTEVLSWVLGWGEKVAIISPPSLRSEWARQAEAMARMAREIAEREKKKLGNDGDEDDTPS
jgi:predicted DNA-binding transcriptional regulator YafY